MVNNLEHLYTLIFYQNYYQDYQMEFIPMLWGGNTSDSDIENVKIFYNQPPRG